MKNRIFYLVLLLILVPIAIYIAPNIPPQNGNDLDIDLFVLLFFIILILVYKLVPRKLKDWMRTHIPNITIALTVVLILLTFDLLLGANNIDYTYFAMFVVGAFLDIFKYYKNKNNKQVD